VRRAGLAALALLPGLLLAAWYALSAFRSAGSLGFPLDDAWIHAQFARNLATGRGFTYTGTDWVAGSTAPAWTLLLAAGYFVSGSVVAAGVVLGIALQIVAGVYAMRLARLLEAPRAVAWTAGTIVAVTPIVVWGAVSGMEVPLAAAMTLAGLDHHFRARSLEGPRRHLGIALLGASTLARPENVALVLVVAACECIGGDPLRVRLTRCLRALLVIFITLIPLVALSYATIGRPLPTTFYAKSGPGIVRAVQTQDWAMAQRALGTFGPQGMSNMWLILWDQHSWAALLVLLGFGAGIAAGSTRRTALTLLAMLLVVPYAMGATSPQRLKPDNVRYAAQLVVLASPLMVLGITRIVRLPAAAIVALAITAAVTGERTLDGAAPFARSVKNIQELHVSAGRWMAGHLPPDAVVAVNDVGAIAYFSGRRILDLEGLVSPEVLPYRVLPQRGLRVVMDMKPDYVAIFPGWYPELARAPGFREVHRVTISDNYISAGDTIVVYAAPWTERD
jgi:hypothetical protein